MQLWSLMNTCAVLLADAPGLSHTLELAWLLALELECSAVAVPAAQRVHREVLSPAPLQT